MYTISVTTDENFKKILIHLGGLHGALRDAAKRALVRSVTHVSSQVLGSGRVPFRRGDLRRSILPFYKGTEAKDGEMEGGVGTDKVYARIHEYGGTFTRNMAWGRKTRPYQVTYKERAYLRVPFQQAAPTIERIFSDELEKASRIK